MSWARSVLVGCRIVVACGLLGALSQPVLAMQQRQAQPGGQAVSLRVDHAFLGEVYAGAWYDYETGAFYVSPGDLFRILQIKFAADLDAQEVTGFYLDRERQYRIDLAARTVQVGDSVYTFETSDVVTRPLGYFFRAEALSDWFDFDLRADMRSLAVYLVTDEPMPVTLAYMRARQRSRLSRGRPLDESMMPPILYERERRWLAGGVITYNAGTSVAYDGAEGLAPRYRLGVAAGMELLGADFEAALRADGTGDDIGLKFRRVQWRYVPSPNPYASEVVAGAMRSSGLKSFRYYGVRVTNEPVRFRSTYGYYRVSGRTEPGWEVELHVNNQIRDFQEAGPDGRYEFVIPLSYGSTLASVKIYGPSGQFKSTSSRLQVPFTFVPPGEVYYALDAGRTVRNDALLGQATVAVGLSNWLTNRVGVDYLSPLGTISTRKPFRIYNSLAARFGSYLFSIDAAPSVSYRASAQAFYPSLASVEGSYEIFEDASFYNPLGVRNQAALRVNAPLKIRRWAMNLRAAGRRQVLAGGLTRYSFRPGFLMQVGGGLRLNTDMTLMLSSPPGGALQWSDAHVNTRFTYALSRREIYPLPLRGLLLTGAFGYDLARNRMETVQLTVSRDVFDWGRVRLQWQQNLLSQSTNLGLQLILNFPSTRTTTNVRWSPSGTFASQNVGGSVSYDPFSGDLIFERSNWIGKSAVSMRMFVDYNGNDRFDRGEPVLEDADLRFWQATRTRRANGGIIYAHNLRPYSRYNVSINEATIRNPMWIPKADSFGIVTDPNRIKTIDIPFYVGGIVTGGVLRQEGEETYPIPGLRVYVMDMDGDFEAMLPVYSDGSFYKMGLPPGDYRAEVDRSQLDILELISVPAQHRFTVEVTKDGDVVDGVDFLLKPGAAAAGEEATTSRSSPSVSG